MKSFNASRLIKPLLTQGLRLGLKYGFNPLCALCDGPCETTLALCDACLADLPRINYACDCCGLPLNQATVDSDKCICGDCLQHPKPFQQTRCALLYQNPTNHLMHLFKQQAQWQLGHLLCDLWLQQNAHLASDAVINNGVLVPIPSHTSRITKRGYCPSQFIAEHLGQHLGIEVKPLLNNQRLTAPQKSLNRAQRLRNLDDVFICRTNTLCPTSTRIVLIDDVITTGATVIAASRALNAAGFYDIHTWALARTPFNN